MGLNKNGIRAFFGDHDYEIDIQQQKGQQHNDFHDQLIMMLIEPCHQECKSMEP